MTSDITNSGVDHYSDIALEALEHSAMNLFQARKVGVRVDVPDVVRESLLSRHGQRARKVLDMIDGNVTL